MRNANNNVFKFQLFLSTGRLPFRHRHRFLRRPMATSASQTSIGFPLIPVSPRCMRGDQPRIARIDCVTVKRMLRRSILQKIPLIPVFANASYVLAAPMDMKDPDVIRTLKLASGVKIQEIVEGDGPVVRDGDVVEVNYVCRRSNGYFVHSTVDQFSGESAPVILTLDDSQVIEGLKEVLIGMKAGGKRRALIPPSVGYINENLAPIPEEFGPRRSLLSHANEPLIFEVQLLKILQL